MCGNNREEMKVGVDAKRKTAGGRGEEKRGESEEKKKQRSSRKDLRLRNGTRKNESSGGRRSPSRKRSIQKLNSASSSKIRIQQRGVTAQERLDLQGERFSSYRKGNRKYRGGQRTETNRTAAELCLLLFFKLNYLIWLPRVDFHGHMWVYHSIDLSSWHASFPRRDKRIFWLWEGRRFSFRWGSSRAKFFFLQGLGWIKK